MHTSKPDATKQPAARREGARLMLEGALTMDTVPSLMPAARAACAQGGVDLVDFAGVTALDSAAIALVLELRRTRGAGLRLENLPSAALKLARLYSVADQLGIEA